MKFRLALGIAMLAAISGCDGRSRELGTLLSRAQALKIAEQTIKDRGLERKEYSLSTYGNELSEDGKEWLFGYERQPVPCPGCFFLITVDRVTGRAIFIPGE